MAASLGEPPYLFVMLNSLPRSIVLLACLSVFSGGAVLAVTPGRPETFW